MKIGVATDDGKTVSPHFGMAKFYLVFEMEDGTIKGKEMRPKTRHHHGREHGDTGAAIKEGEEHHGHAEMLSNVNDCEALVARGMGPPMYNSILQMGIRPYLTRIAVVEDVARAYINGTLDDRGVERS